jgi:hypothetical protein
MTASSSVLQLQLTYLQHCADLTLSCRFKQYAGMVQDKLMPQYGASWHWAKIEVPEDAARLAAMRAALAERFPLQRFNQYRCGWFDIW